MKQQLFKLPVERYSPQDKDRCVELKAVLHTTDASGRVGANI